MDSRQRHAQDWIDEIVSNGRGVTSWEHDFVESISLQLSARKELSTKQLDTLERIYTDRT